ncbi:MAG: fumarylacetoacetate hydrolase family protein [Acidimicrobiales bacterium]|jgi:acylpyruvate hydrolase
MRLATVRTADGTRAARLEGDRLLLLRAPDVGVLLVSTSPASRLDTVMALESTGEIAFTDASFAPLVPHPEKIFCVGLNYRAHILEMSRELPDYPTLFAKFASGLIGAHDDLVLPLVSKAVDWEVELGVVIGRRIRRATLEQAHDAIAGFTVVNDISMRDWQARTTQYLQGKAFDASTPVGPVLVTGDEIGDAVDLEVRCELDGIVMQRGRTSDLLFGPTAVVSYISQFATLCPGDLISTGTPGGVGAGRDPQVFLEPGQVLTTAIEGIGSCVNRCVPEES